MTVEELEFKAAGCCGEYQVAQAGDLHATKADEGYRVVRLIDGVLIEDLGVIDEATLSEHLARVSLSK